MTSHSVTLESHTLHYTLKMIHPNSRVQQVQTLRTPSHSLLSTRPSLSPTISTPRTCRQPEGTRRNQKEPEGTRRNQKESDRIAQPLSTLSLLSPNRSTRSQHSLPLSPNTSTRPPRRRYADALSSRLHHTPRPHLSSGHGVYAYLPLTSTHSHLIAIS